ncbi:MAG: methylmalonyl-CoA mutase, partial [Planctomycetota bacterium]
DGNDDHQVEILEIPHTVEVEQCARLAKLRAARSSADVARALDAIRTAARNGDNVMSSLVAASLVRCTLGEQVQAMADVYGRYSGGPEW